MELSDKLKTLFGLAPEVKAKADNAEAALLALGVTSKEETKMEDKDTKPKDEKEEEQKEEEVEKKETAVDATALLQQIQTTFEATSKETADLKTLLEATSRETQELKATIATGFETVAKGLEQRDVTIKQLQDTLAQESAKVKELAGEIPNAARNIYTPSESFQNIFGRIANGDLSAVVKETESVPQVPNPTSQAASVNPIASFIEQANVGIGIAKNPNQALPQ